VSGSAARVGVPVVLAAIVLGSVPGLAPNRLLDTMGVSQSWGVFAPRPASQRIALSAEVTFVDGGHATWTPPRAGPAAAALGYHWQMWTSAVVADSASSLWAPAARWIAANGGWGSRRVARVTLRRSWTDLAGPGTRGPPAITNEFDFYTLDLARGRR